MSEEEYEITVTDFINLAANNILLDRTRIETGKANFRLAKEYSDQQNKELKEIVLQLQKDFVLKIEEIKNNNTHENNNKT